MPPSLLPPPTCSPSTRALYHSTRRTSSRRRRLPLSLRVPSRDDGYHDPDHDIDHDRDFDFSSGFSSDYSSDSSSGCCFDSGSGSRSESSATFANPLSNGCLCLFPSATPTSLYRAASGYHSRPRPSPHSRLCFRCGFCYRQHSSCRYGFDSRPYYRSGSGRVFDSGGFFRSGLGFGPDFETDCGCCCCCCCRYSGSGCESC